MPAVRIRSGKKERLTYQKYPHLHIPNTTNSLDGMFSQLKAKLAVHRGLRRDRRYKVISEILGGDKS